MVQPAEKARQPKAGAVPSAPHVYTRDIVLGANDSLAKIAALLKPTEEILDVGTGTGAVGRFVHALGGKAVDGITISEQELSIAKPHYRNVVICDLDTEPVPKALAKARYDTIICADVLEHLSRPVAALQKLRTLLKPNGRIILSIPNVTHRSVLLSLLNGRYPRRDEGLLDRTHVQFFDRLGLRELVVQAQLHVHSEDAVLRDLVDTEFANVRAETMPAAVVNFACSGLDSQVYQFIWVLQAEPPEAALVQVRVEPASTPRFQLAAMQDLGEGIDNGLHLFATGLQQAGIQRLRFQGGLDARCKRLRVGLADRVGIVEFMGLNIRNNAGDSAFAWSGSWTPVVKSNACAWSAELGPHGGTLVRATAADAFVLLDLPALNANQGPLYLEVELSCAAVSAQDASAGQIQRLTDALRHAETVLRTERAAQAIQQVSAQRLIDEARLRADQLEAALLGANGVVAGLQVAELASRDEVASVLQLLATSRAEASGQLQQSEARIQEFASALSAEQAARSQLERIRNEELINAQSQIGNSLRLLELERADHKAGLGAEQATRAELERIRHEELVNAHNQIGDSLRLLDVERASHREELGAEQAARAELERIRNKELVNAQNQIGDSLRLLDVERAARMELERIRNEELANAQSQINHSLRLLDAERTTHRAELGAEQAARAELERIRNEELVNLQGQIGNSLRLLDAERAAHRLELATERAARTELERIRNQELTDSKAQINTALALLDQERAAHRQMAEGLQSALQTANEAHQQELQRLLERLALAEHHAEHTAASLREEKSATRGLEQQINAILGSRSWRLTEPLRRLLTWMKR